MNQVEPTKITGVLIENTSTKRRKEEGARKHVHISFPVGANPETSHLLDMQVGNPVDFYIGVIQPQLAAVNAAAAGAETDEVTVEMVVNGEPAKVRTHRKRNGSTPSEPEGHNEAHLFIDTGDERGSCSVCTLTLGEGNHLSDTAASLIEDIYQGETPAGVEAEA